jgi:hypothetical protein
MMRVTVRDAGSAAEMASPIGWWHVDGGVA